ncbi:MAG: metalloregulator ArsR/SmtB family transcription factor [Pseudomonadota bacterium]
MEHAKLFSALSNEVRLRCLHLVAEAEELCVCEAVSAMQISQPAASKALASLKEAGLLSVRRDANWTYYSLSNDIPQATRQIVTAALTGVHDDPACITDRSRFSQLAPREEICG